MRPVKFFPDAQIEMYQAAEYYESQQTDLGKRFLEDLQKTVRHIKINPLIYRQIGENMRQCKVDNFPYGVIFRIQQDHIEVIAVIHLKRKPGYWKDRI